MLKFFATTEIRKNNNPKNRVIIVGKLLTIYYSNIAIRNFTELCNEMCQSVIFGSLTFRKGLVLILG